MHLTTWILLHPNVKFQTEIWLMSFSIWWIPITAQQRHQSSSSNTFPKTQLLHFTATWDFSSRMITSNQLLKQSHAPLMSVTRMTRTAFAIWDATTQQWQACRSCHQVSSNCDQVSPDCPARTPHPSWWSYIFNILTQLDFIYSTITNTDIKSYNILNRLTLFFFISCLVIEIKSLKSTRSIFHFQSCFGWTSEKDLLHINTFSWVFFKLELSIS